MPGETVVEAVLRRVEAGTSHLADHDLAVEAEAEAEVETALVCVEEPAGSTTFYFQVVLAWHSETYPFMPVSIHTGTTLVT